MAMGQPDMQALVAEEGKAAVTCEFCGELYIITPEEIEWVIEGSSGVGWPRHEKALLTAVEELLSNYMISDETWAVLGESWNEAQLMELPVLVGTYLSTAMQQNSMRIPPNNNKPGLRHR